MFLSREKRQQRRQFKDFVRWLRELTDERRTFLIAFVTERARFATW